jgi:hypothetical protein
MKMATLSRRMSRASWTDRAWKAHYTQQIIRFVRLFIVAFVTQLVVWSQHGAEWHMDWKVLGSLALASVEFVWRELFPTTPPAVADPPAPQDPEAPQDVTPNDTSLQDDVTVDEPTSAGKMTRKRTTQAKSTASRRRR